eukprot:1147227-Pelagomonas_calceolata.AAC.2
MRPSGPLQAAASPAGAHAPASSSGPWLTALRSHCAWGCPPASHLWRRWTPEVGAAGLPFCAGDALQLCSALSACLRCRPCCPSLRACE